MTLIRNQLPWASQPQEAAQLRTDAAFVWLPSVDIDRDMLVSRLGMSAGQSMVRGTTPYGVVGSVPNGSGGPRYSASGLPGGSSYTVLTVVLDNTNRGTFRNPLDGDHESNPARNFQLRFNTSDRPEFVVFDVASGFGVVTGTSSPSLDKPTVLAARVDGLSATVWMDGRQEGQAGLTNPARAVSAGTAPQISIGDHASGAQPYYGPIYVSVYWPRALSDAELASMSTIEGVWAFLFEPQDEFMSFAGSASGTAELAGSYSIAGGGTSDFAGSYSILAGAAVDLAGAFAIQGSGFVDFSGSYLIDHGPADLIFDGPNKLIIIATGKIVVGVRELWSHWSDWLTVSDNSKYLPAMRSTGGDETEPGKFIPAYVFLLNGWKIRPFEGDHTLTINDGLLYVDGGGDPFVSTLGDFTVRIRYEQPVQALTVATGGSAGPSAAEIAAAVWSYATRNVNAEQMNGFDIIGDGSEASPWRGVGVPP